MKTLSAIVLILPLLFAPGFASADQKDARLGDLFAALHAAPDFLAAQGVELTIWGIWIESKDTAVELLMDDGLSAMVRSDFRSALGKFDQMVRISPGFAEGWNKRATVHYLLGNYVESLHDINKALMLEPRHFGALSGRGLVYMEFEEDQLALDSFKEALEIHPRLPGAGHNAEALRLRLENNKI